MGTIGHSLVPRLYNIENFPFFLCTECTAVFCARTQWVTTRFENTHSEYIFLLDNNPFLENTHSEYILLLDKIKIYKVLENVSHLFLACFLYFWG